MSGMTPVPTGHQAYLVVYGSIVMRSLLFSPLEVLYALLALSAVVHLFSMVTASLQLTMLDRWLCHANVSAHCLIRRKTGVYIAVLLLPNS